MRWPEKVFFPSSRMISISFNSLPVLSIVLILRPVAIPQTTNGLFSPHCLFTAKSAMKTKGLSF